MFTYRKIIIDSAVQLRLPSIYGFREFVDDGGMVSYGASITDTYHRAAGYVDRVSREQSPPISLSSYRPSSNSSSISRPLKRSVSASPAYATRQRGRGDRIAGRNCCGCMSLLLAQSGHSVTAVGCPLLGEKRTSKFKSVTSAFDPKATWVAQIAVMKPWGQPKAICSSWLRAIWLPSEHSIHHFLMLASNASMIGCHCVCWALMNSLTSDGDNGST